MNDTALPDRDAAGSQNNTRRLVLLGASNLTRSLSTVVGVAQQAWHQPLDILAAHGHGRSYGHDSSVLGRRLPGMITCGLWEALRFRSPLPAAAVVTDIGNDILYGDSVNAIAGWIEACFDRLSRLCDRVLVTELPLSTIQGIVPCKFQLLRGMLFPGSTVRLPDVVRAAHRLNRAVVNLADQYGVHVVKPEPSWYGFDPIHIKCRAWTLAWGKIFQCFFDDEFDAHHVASIRRWIKVRCAVPERRVVFGWKQSRPQPSVRLGGGGELSTY